MIVPTCGVNRKILIAHKETIAPRPAADRARAFPYHSGLYLSGISEIRTAARNPASAPPRWPNISIFDATDDIMMTEDNMNRIHVKVRSLFGPITSHERRISAIQTPIRPNPAVDAPTANLNGSIATDIIFPMTPHSRYKSKNFFFPNCFSIPNPIRSWKNILKNRCIMFACSVMGNTNLQICPDAIEGPHDAPRSYNVQTEGIPFI